MEFDGLAPFTPGYPISSVGDVAQEFDLHNDGDFREFSIDFRDRFLRLVWLLKQPAWQIPDTSETWQRKTLAGVSLIFSGVHSVTLSGIILDDSGSNVLDFLEYAPLDGRLGETRIVFLNSAEANVVANKCQLRTIESP